MNRTIETLLAVQDYDSKIRQAEKEMRDIPARKEAQVARLNGHKADVEQAQEKLKAEQAGIKNLELEIAAKKEAIVKLRTQQFSLKTNQEFRAMDEEIAGVEKHIAEIEDRELAAMGRMELLKSDLRTTEDALKDEEKTVQADVATLDERLKSATATVEALRQEREKAAAAVEDKDWLARYVRIFERRDYAIVPLREGVCTGCQMQVPPQTAQDARKSDKIVACDHCGRLLHC